MEAASSPPVSEIADSFALYWRTRTRVIFSKIWGRGIISSRAAAGGFIMRENIKAVKNRSIGNLRTATPIRYRRIKFEQFREFW